MRSPVLLSETLTVAHCWSGPDPRRPEIPSEGKLKSEKAICAASIDLNDCKDAGALRESLEALGLPDQVRNTRIGCFTALPVLLLFGRTCCPCAYKPPQPNTSKQGIAVQWRFVLLVLQESINGQSDEHVETECDVVVIGSGAGGGVAACLLAQTGAKVGTLAY